MSNKIIDLKGSILTLSVLKLLSDDFAKTQQALKEKVDQAPSFFVGIPVVLEPEVELQDPTFLALMVEFLHQLQMIPIGIRTNDETIINQAQFAGLAVFPPEEKKAKKANKAKNQPASNQADSQASQEVSGAQATQLAPEPTESSESTATTQQTVHATEQEVALEVSEPQPSAEVVQALTPQAPSIQTAMFVNRSVRSGQQIHAPNQDVVITGSVNPGAEVIAGGNITVFGKVLGKVIAGDSGNTKAKIFATQLNAEIVCIAGIYKLADDIEEEYKTGLVQIELKQDKLQEILVMSKLS